MGISIIGNNRQAEHIHNYNCSSMLQSCQYVTFVSADITLNVLWVIVSTGTYNNILLGLDIVEKESGVCVLLTGSDQIQSKLILT